MLKNRLTILALVGVLSACSSSPLYKSQGVEPHANLTLFPTGRGNTWASICYQGQWHKLHENPLSGSAIHYDISHFRRTYPEAEVSVPANRPLILSYNIYWSDQKCQTSQLIQLNSDKSYVIRGKFVNDGLACRAEITETDDESTKLPMIKNTIPCDQFDTYLESWKNAQREKNQ